MRIQLLQHVPYEGPASIQAWADEHGHPLHIHHLYRGDSLPDLTETDFVIAMGGPMSVTDVAAHPWLVEEQTFLRQVADSNRPMLGICLGAQLIASALGAPVTRNRCPEIGWFPIETDPKLQDSILTGVFPDTLQVFHWHGDTFALPEGAQPIASSEACDNQGFIIDNRIIGLQFHLETTPHAADELIKNCAGDLDGSAYVQDRESILADPSLFESTNHLMHAVLDALADVSPVE